MEGMKGMTEIARGAIWTKLAMQVEGAGAAGVIGGAGLSVVARAGESSSAVRAGENSMSAGVAGSTGEEEDRWETVTLLKNEVPSARLQVMRVASAGRTKQ